MSSVTLKELLESGAHFGHQTKRWNPKMARFILCPRNGIYIIDLNKTIKQLDSFLERVKAEVSKGGKVLFVGTKKQIRESVKEQAERCGMPYVTFRWLGGMLTNFKTIKQSLSKLEKIEEMEENGTLEALVKKERLKILKQKEKLLRVLEGIRNMKKEPSMVFIVDTIKEHIALHEAKKLRIPVGAIVDTNCDPDDVDYPIPANDDAIKSVEKIVSTIADVILEAKKSAPAELFEEKIEDTKEEETKDIDSNEDSDEAEDEDAKKVSRPKRRKIVKKKITVEDGE